MKKGAIFFDRDGVVNERIVGGYVKNPSELILNKHTLKAIKTVKEKGYLAIIITNQQGVGKGLMTQNDLDSVHKHLQESMQKAIGARFDDIYYCTDLAGSGSMRRKPQPGMLTEALEEHNVSLERSWFIGDSMTDVEAGNRIGMNTILINKNWGYGGMESPSIHIPDLEYLNGILMFLPKMER